jgi:general secretion pathway protein K
MTRRARARPRLGYRLGHRLGRRGGALVVVISGLALLAALALGAASLTRAGLGAARDDVDMATARWAAESGLALALAGLVDDDGRIQSPRDGRPAELAYGGARLTLVVSDEAGRIDLNAGPPALLAGVLVAAGADPAVARVLADAVVAHRRIRRFAHLAELRGLTGMSAALFEQAADAFTVHGGTAGIDPRVAPPLALRAIPGLDASEVEAYIATRHRVGASAPALGRPFFIDTPASVYRIAVDAELPGRARQRVTAIVRLTQEPGRPYVVLAWQ